MIDDVDSGLGTISAVGGRVTEEGVQTGCHLMRLHLMNFRGFENHEVPFVEFTVLVGRNNAGKSSIVEALRVLSVVVNRSLSLPFKAPPSWLDAVEARRFGVAPDISDLELPDETLFYAYSSAPARLEAHFSNGSSVVVYLGGGKRVFAAFLDGKGVAVRDRKALRAMDLPAIHAMPQPGPVALQEPRLAVDTVRRGRSSRRSPLHFRNQLLQAESKVFEEFKSIVEATWSGIGIESPPEGEVGDSAGLVLIVRNGNFAGDVALLGHGAQVWLQILWFMVNCEPNSVVVLDEPEVYLHPDLQRRIARLVAHRWRQLVMTTHSVEILAEVEPQGVLVVDRLLPRSGFVSSESGLQQAVAWLGSAHNIQLARLWAAKRLLVVEGEDVSMLSQLERVLSSGQESLIEALPSIDVGGWGGWQQVVGSNATVQNALGEDVRVYAVFDSDYHGDDEVRERYDAAAKRGIQLHVWARKELESYFLVPAGIARAIRAKTQQEVALEAVSACVTKQMTEIAQEMRVDILCQFQGEHHKRSGRKDVAVTNREALRRFEQVERGPGGLLGLAPAKGVLGRLSAWSQRTYGVSLTTGLIARFMRAEEVDSEIISVIQALHDGSAFVRPARWSPESP